jgi:dihydropteroate synthase
VKIFRVHDVKANRQAIEVAWAVNHADETLAPSS